MTQKIYVILIKLLEALGDKDLNKKLDEVISTRIGEVSKQVEDQSSHSASMTLTKMILFNL